MGSLASWAKKSGRRGHSGRAPRQMVALVLGLSFWIGGCGRGSIDLIDEQGPPDEPAPLDAAVPDESTALPVEAGTPTAPTQTPPAPPWPTSPTPPDPSCNEACPPGKFCNIQTSRCVECLIDPHCGPRMVCDRIQNRCVQCVQMSDCAYFNHYYASVCERNECRPCVSDAECPFKMSCYRGGCFFLPPPDEEP